MKAEEVARYLQDHPEFFEQYADLLAQIAIPSPHGGRAISITERQMGALRDKVKQLEGKLAELIRFGEENDGIAAKVHKLAVALLAARDNGTVLQTLYDHLGGSFAVPHVAVRLWGAAGSGTAVEFAPVSDEARRFAETLAQPYCGPGAGPDVMAWFGEAGAHVRSLALLALREGGETFGLMVMGSEEPQRFYPGMGTLYVEQIGEMASAALVRTRA
ncbi:MAG: DUF484 family protein [Sterolibacteriaceae bacterium MAG5]|nr:DUF484 family protein [Candidatus Nitricoxidireducens bremensis]